MKKQIIIGTLLFLISLAGTATAQTISGKVTDAEAHPIDGATVILQSIDSTFVDALITDSTGCFRFNRQPAQYRLIFQHILYTTRQQEGTGSDTGTIVLSGKDYTLDEVVIKGEQPLVKVEEGKLSYDLSRLIEHKVVNNAYESLQQLPGVQEINGNLSLAGTPGLSIILNGKPTTMSYEQLVNLLKNTPASRVEKAEVMYSAPPQYHVRGAAINLILKGYRTGESGLKGEVKAGYLHDYKNGAQGGLNLLYTHPKWNIDLLYNTQYRRHRQKTNTYSRHTLNNKIYDIHQQGIIDNKGMTHHIRVGAEYKTNKESNISLAYTSAFTPDQRGHTVSDGNFATSDNRTKANKQMHNLALDYASPAGLKAGVNYLDTANYEPKDEAHFEYSWQWAYHDRFKKAGLTAILGCGFDPGVSGIYTAYAAKHYFDEIQYLDIVDCNAGNHHKAFATNFNPEINIREITQNGRYYENGKWVTTGPLEIHKDLTYPNIGPRDSYLLYHEELESLVKHYPTIKRARFWMTFGQEYLTHLRVIQNIGMARIDEVDYNGMKIVPLQFLKAVLPNPQDLGENYEGETSIGCRIRGLKDGKERTYYVYNNCSHQEAYQETGMQGVSYTTGVPAMIGAMMFFKGEWNRPGVNNVEEFNPDPFMEQLNKQGLPWHEEFDKDLEL